MAKNYKRIGLVLGIAVLFLLSGIVLSALELEFTSFSFLFAAIGILLYGIAFWGYRKKGNTQSVKRVEAFESTAVGLLVSVICLVGIGESAPSHLVGIFIFVLLQSTVALFAKFNFKKRWANILIGLLLAGIGFALIVCNDQYGEEEWLLVLTLLYCLLLIGLIFRWFFKQIKSIIQLKNERQKTELLHLQSQVNPHFFFNMLNNLYGTVGKDTAKAQALILKLSDMMRYSIYDGQKEYVKLSEEVGYLKNYIELHKMRYHKDIDVQFVLEIEDDNQAVMPLLFIILLENAFKHGVENLRSNAYVSILLKTIGNTLRFEVENNFEPTASVKDAGIGLKNLKRRLELAYPNEHSLNLSSNENIYRAQLMLSL